MSRNAYYRFLFLAAAWWNFLAAAGAAFLLPAQSLRAHWGLPIPADTLSLQLFASCVTLFGLGYYLVSRDLSSNRGLVLIGVIGKPLVFAVFLGQALAGNIPMILVAPAVGDLIFGALFLEFYLHARNNKQ